MQRRRLEAGEELQVGCGRLEVLVVEVLLLALVVFEGVCACAGDGGADAELMCLIVHLLGW